MKTEKRTDREIAQTLQDAGRVKYNYKTIGSRWKRLRMAMAKAKDQELNQQIAVWRVEEVLTNSKTSSDPLIIVL